MFPFMFLVDESKMCRRKREMMMCMCSPLFILGLVLYFFFYFLFYLSVKHGNQFVRLKIGKISGINYSKSKAPFIPNYRIHFISDVTAKSFHLLANILDTKSILVCSQFPFYLLRLYLSVSFCIAHSLTLHTLDTREPKKHNTDQIVHMYTEDLVAFNLTKLLINIKWNSLLIIYILSIARS